jgi:hypothetical protein
MLRGFDPVCELLAAAEHTAHLGRSTVVLIGSQLTLHLSASRTVRRKKRVCNPAWLEMLGKSVPLREKVLAVAEEAFWG